MFTSHLVTALLLGLDGFLVCLAVGALPGRPARRVSLPLSLGLCDGLATWVGAVAGMERVRSALAWGEWLGPAVVAGYGLYVLCLAWRCRGLATGHGGRLWAFLLPLGLSLDNLVAGAGAAGAQPALAALLFGATSGALALLGMTAGAALGSRRRFRAAWLSGALLLLVAAGLVVKDVFLG